MSNKSDYITSSTQAKKMKKLPLLILISFLILSCGEISRTENLLVKVDSLKIENDSLIKVLGKEKLKSNYWFDAEYDGIKLIESGISNPEELIKNTIREKTELIPIEAVLGGKMHFGNIQVLSSEWLIAEFDDGHVQGRGIYEYTMNNNGELEFKLLNSIVPE